jgi:hypothetical protein
MSGEADQLYVAFRIATLPVFGNKAKSLSLSRFRVWDTDGPARLTLDDAKEQ